jgi:hypothetical protein
MSTSISLSVLVFWVVAAIMATVTISAAIYAGYRRQYGLLFWRRAKFISACLGIVGLALLLLNIEKAIRDSVVVPSKALALGLFYDTKFLTSQFAARVCSHEQEGDQAKLQCSDATNLDRALRPADALNPEAYSQISYPPFWQTSPTVSEDYRTVLRRVNDRFSLIRTVIPSAAEQSLLTEERRIGLFFVATVLIILALAGSIGEAAYQLAEAKNASKNQ